MQATAGARSLALGARAMAALRTHSQLLLTLLDGTAACWHIWSWSLASDVEYVASALRSRGRCVGDVEHAPHEHDAESSSAAAERHSSLPWLLDVQLAALRRRRHRRHARAQHSIARSRRELHRAAIATRVPRHRTHLEIVRAHAESRDRRAPVDVIVNDPNERAASIVNLLTVLAAQYSVRVGRLTMTDL